MCPSREKSVLHILLSKDNKISILFGRLDSMVYFSAHQLIILFLNGARPDTAADFSRATALIVRDTSSPLNM